MTAMKLIGIGNSVGVVLPKDVLTKLGAGKGDILYATQAAGGELRLAVRSPKVQRQIELGEQIMHEYRDTFETLAK